MEPPSVPKAIVYTGMPASAASAAPSEVSRPTVVSPSLSSTITPGATSDSGSAEFTSSGSGGERVADGGRLGQLQIVDAVLHRAAIERGVDVDVDLPGERDQSDLDIRVDLIDEVACRFLRGDEPRGVDVVGLHRQRHVEQHEDAALARGPLGVTVDGSGDGDHGGGQAEQLQAGDDVASPAWT